MQMSHCLPLLPHPISTGDCRHSMQLHDAFNWREVRRVPLYILGIDVTEKPFAQLKRLPDFDTCKARKRETFKWQCIQSTYARPVQEQMNCKRTSHATKRQCVQSPYARPLCSILPAFFLPFFFFFFDGVSMHPVDCARALLIIGPASPDKLEMKQNKECRRAGRTGFNLLQCPYPERHHYQDHQWHLQCWLIFP